MSQAVEKYPKVQSDFKSLFDDHSWRIARQITHEIFLRVSCSECSEERCVVASLRAMMGEHDGGGL